MSVAPGTRLASYEISRSSAPEGWARSIARATSAESRRRTEAHRLVGGRRGAAALEQRGASRGRASTIRTSVRSIEIGEDGDELFITMELLGGETLAERILRGRWRSAQAIPSRVEALTALQRHSRPGPRPSRPQARQHLPDAARREDPRLRLARPASLSSDPALTQTATRLTQTGTMMGTPRYMSPEQIQGQSTDARTDLFAMGATLYEMLAGKPAFAGATSLDVLHATLHDAPPALGGSRTIESVNRIVQRLLAKSPEDRPASASLVAEELKACLVLGDVEAVPRARTMTWLIVLPFRVLRADAETDFLAFSLPDAIASSLAGLRSLGVRSTPARRDLPSARSTSRASPPRPMSIS